MKTTTAEDIRKAFKGYVPVGEHGFRHFAVMILIVKTENDDETPVLQSPSEIIYEVRAAKLDRQPGEICFPGGLIEAGETPLKCALRETEEEIGICREDIEVVAELDSVHSTSGSQIHCFLGIISREAFAGMKLNADEVGEVFTVSVDDLLKTEPEMYESRLIQEPDPDFPYDKVTDGRMYPWRSGSAPVPVYDVNGRIIWGLTGRITKQFLEVLKCSD